MLTRRTAPAEAARGKKVLEGEVIYLVPGGNPNLLDMLREVVPLAGGLMVDKYSAAVTLAVFPQGGDEADRRRAVAAGAVLHTQEVLLSALVQQRLDKGAHATG